MRAGFATVLETAALISSVFAGFACSHDDAGATLGSQPAGAGSGASCGDTQTDPRNCGTCGHDCKGGACQSGVCAALGPNVLASGQRTPAGIVVDATQVYWIDRGTYSTAGQTHTAAQLLKCAKSGCNNAPTVLATGAWADVTNLAVDGANVYWGASGQILKCSIDGCKDGPTVLWSGEGGVGQVAVEDASLYFEVPDSEQAYVCSTEECDGGTALAVLPDGSGNVPTQFTGPIAIAVDEEDLYVGESAGPFGAVFACTRSDCSRTAHAIANFFALNGMGELGGLALPNGPSPSAPLLAVDATNVYFASTPVLGGGGPAPLPGAGGETSALGSLSFAAKDGSNPPATLLDDLSFPSAIAVDGTMVYVAQWGDESEAGRRPAGSGQIVKCAVAGCNGAATTVEDYVNYPQGIAVDDVNVYWTDFGTGIDPSGSDDGRVMVRAK